MSVKIRAATRADIPVLHGLYKELDSFHVDLCPGLFRAVEGNVRPDSLLSDNMKNPDAVYLLAEEDGEGIGMAFVILGTKPTPAMMQPRKVSGVEDLVVAQRARGRGIGRALLDAAKDWSVQKGATVFRLSVWTCNEESRAFYDAYGIKPAIEVREMQLE